MTANYWVGTTIRALILATFFIMAAFPVCIPVSNAHPGHTGHDSDVFTQWDENDQSWLTDRFEQTLHEMMQRYPEVTEIYLTAQPLGVPGAYAGAGANPYGDPIIVIEESWAENPDAFVTSVLADIAGGWSPPGCDPIRLIAVHEFGHVLAAVRGDVAQDIIIAETAGSDFVNGLHDYGAANVEEALATSFSAVVCGSQTPLEQRIYDILVTA